MVDEKNLEELVKDSKPSLAGRVVNSIKGLYSRLVKTKKNVKICLCSVDLSEYDQNCRKYLRREISWEEYHELNSQIKPKITERVIYAQPKVGRENPYLGPHQ